MPDDPGATAVIMEAVAEAVHDVRAAFGPEHALVSVLAVAVRAAAPVIARASAADQLERDIQLAISEHAVYERWVKGADGCSRIHQIPFADLLATRDTPPTTTEETR